MLCIEKEIEFARSQAVSTSISLFFSFIQVYTILYNVLLQKRSALPHGNS